MEEVIETIAEDTFYIEVNNPKQEGPGGRSCLQTNINLKCAI